METIATRHRILIIDDLEKNIQLLANVLADQYEIEYATKGMDALQWIRDESFDLILLDIVMPGIDGMEVCERIRQDPRFDSVPILFLTAKNDTESIVRAFRLGGRTTSRNPFVPRNCWLASAPTSN
ncbi:MAG: response regulator [Bacteroidales bacterium]